MSYIDLDGLEENKTIELNWKISEQIDTRPELRVPMDEIWGIERFGGLDLGIVSEKGIESKDGKYTIHGIESGPNKGNWLVREHYENGDYKNLVIAGPEAFKEVRSGKFSERGTALNLIAAGEMLGADPTSTYRENILNGWKEAWTPENIVSSLLLAIAVIKTPLSGMARKVGVNAAKTSTNVVEEVAVHGNSLKSLKPTWGYKLYSNDGTFLKNGITSKLIPETRYTKAFMSDKYMEAIPFPNRLEAYQWEFQQNQILRGPLNLNKH